MTINKQLCFLTLDKEFTPVIRKGRRPILSPEDSNPRINLDNAFAAIDPSCQSDIDDDGDQSSQVTNQSVPSDVDSDYGISTMTITNRKELTDLMTTVVPIAEPTIDRSTKLSQAGR